MKRIYILPIFIVVMVGFFASSCVKDKGNYDYKDIYEVVIDIPFITENDNKFEAYYLENLKLSPSVTDTNGKEVNLSDYDFVWSLMLRGAINDENGEPVKAKVIGNTSELDYFMADDIGAYYCNLVAEHKETKARTYYEINLEVKAINGWMIVDEDAAGNADIHLIRDQQIIPGFPKEMAAVEKNLYSTANSGSKPAGVKFVSMLDGGLSIRYNYIYLFKEDGYYRVNPGTHKLMDEDYKSLFMTNPSAQKPMAHAFPLGRRSANEVMINNNEVHVQGWNMIGIAGKLPAPLAVFGTPVKVTSHLTYINLTGSATDNTAVLYQTREFGGAVAGRFVTISTGRALTYPSIADGLFNPGKINPNPDVNELILQYMGTGNNEHTMAIFKDIKDGDKPWLLVMDLLKRVHYTAVMKKDMSQVTNFASATHYTFGRRGDIMFYATNGGVYSYAYNALNAVAKEVLTLGGSEQVVSMKLYGHSANADFNSKLLFIATYDGAEGKVYKIAFNPLNGIVASVETYTGFGKIIDMYNKE